jgi:hypothetical protein
MFLEPLGKLLNLLELLSCFNLLDCFFLVFLVYEQVHLELGYFYIFQIPCKIIFFVVFSFGKK